VIQWFPGHMYKASKEVKKILPQVHLLIEVLDARLPFSSQNPMLDRLRGDKPSIKILNKCDLADPDRTRQWQHFLEQRQGIKTLALSSAEPARVKTIIELSRKLIPSRLNRGEDIHALICGIPNVGKSTIINHLSGRTIAKTGNEPAVTKNQQRIDLGQGLVLIDTPGMLWGNIENENSGYRLALSGAIKDTALDHEDVAWFAAEWLLKEYSSNLMRRYQLDQAPLTEQQLLDQIGRFRGCLRAGAEVDLAKVSSLLIREFRSGELGEITLETPEIMERELEQLALIRVEKAARKTAKKMDRKKNRNKR